MKPDKLLKNEQEAEIIPINDMYDAKWLRRKIAALYMQGIVDADKDVAEATGYHKSNLSNFLNPDSGIRPSRFFLKKFKEVYGQYLMYDPEAENKELKKQIKELKAALRESRMLNEVLMGKKRK